MTTMQAGIIEDRGSALSEMVQLLMSSSEITHPDLIAVYPADRRLWPARLAGEQRWGVYDPANRTVTEVDPRQDTDLPGLADWIDRAALVSYRPGDRATFRWEEGNVVQYVRVVKPQQSGHLIKHWLRMANLVDRAVALRVPHLECFDHRRGWLAFTMVSGPLLHRVLSRRQGEVEAIQAAAAAIADLQSLPTEQLPSGNDNGLGQWHQYVHVHDPDPNPETHRIIDEAFGELPQTIDPRSVMVHGGFHDKNILVGSRPALLNLDTLRRGSAAEDVGNLAAHLILRDLQGIDTDGLVPTLLTAYSESGGKASATDIHIETRRSLLRLACVYRFRPPWNHLSEPLARRAMESA